MYQRKSIHQGRPLSRFSLILFLRLLWTSFQRPHFVNATSDEKHWRCSISHARRRIACIQQNRVNAAWNLNVDGMSYKKIISFLQLGVLRQIEPRTMAAITQWDSSHLNHFHHDKHNNHSSSSTSSTCPSATSSSAINPLSWVGVESSPSPSSLSELDYV